MTAHNFAAIILAAGYSSRMGRFKPLLPLGHSTVIEHTLSIFQANSISDIFVVVGHNHNEMACFLKNKDAIAVENPDFHEGMFSSIRRGVSCLPPKTDAFFIMPVDIPFVKTDTVKLLLDAYQKKPGYIIRPCFEGKAGHPPLIPGHLYETILTYKGDGGLREILTQNARITVTVDVADRNILFDMDYPKDYKNGLKQFNPQV